MPSFPHRFGDWTPPEPLRELEGTPIAWVEDHGDDAVALLLSQFQGKPRIEALVRAYLAGVQDLHDAIYQVLIGIWIDGAEGVQLDGIGEILGLPRSGWTDTTYRVFLRAQVLVLRSHGTWPDMVGILRVIGVTLALTSVADSGIAAMRVALGELLDGDVLPADVYRLLLAAKPAGVRLTVEYPTVGAEDSFTWADADVDQADDRLGWPSDDAASDGGLWAGELVSTVTA